MKGGFLMQKESERVEFKSELNEQIYKEVIAFANTDGGTIFLGVDDEGKAIGLPDLDDTYTRLTNGIRDAIHPDVTLFVHYSLQENDVIRIEVGEGSSKPYYLKSKGLKPSGVYVRQGATCAMASPDEIKKMIKESDGDVFESARSLEQALTFEAASAFFARRGVPFSKEKFRGLGLQQDGLFTNLALLLSDQCPHSIKIGVYNDESCTEFRDSKEFKGSILKQFEDAFAYLGLCNKTVSVIQGYQRIDRQDYPTEAIREALLNAIIHRDYSYSGSIIVNVNDEKMEFISLGGLLPGLTPFDIRLGISEARNRRLAEIFFRLGLVESYGTGIRRIYKLYEGCVASPSIETSPNAFRIALPNKNMFGSIPKKKIPHLEVEKGPGITKQMQAVLEYMAEYGDMTDEDLQRLLSIKGTRSYLLSRKMSEEGLIDIVGRGTNKKYRLASKEAPR